MFVIVSPVPGPEETLSKSYAEGKERREGRKESGREDGSVDG